MTEQEAVDILKEHRFWQLEQQNKELCSALDIAIPALEEVQQYRALGTMEDIKQIKRDLNIQIEHSEHLAEVLKSTKSILSKREKLLKEYSKIGTPEELRAVMEKCRAVLCMGRWI